MATHTGLVSIIEAGCTDGLQGSAAARDVASLADVRRHVASGSVMMADGVAVLCGDAPGDGDRAAVFVQGLRIATLAGSEAVEGLSPGATVLTPRGPRIVARVEHRQVDAASHRRRDVLYPVRVKAGALADGVPSRDLLLLQDQCLVLDGALVPARMLVNGVSVVIEREMRSYLCLRIEWQKSGWAAASAGESPLVTASPMAVSAVYQEVARRAGVAAASAGLASDAGLRVVTDTGEVIAPLTVRGGVARFILPGDVQSVRLRSGTSCPADRGGAFIDDRRTLGVLVGAISLHSDVQQVEISTHLHDADLDGWSMVESAPMRWTTGDAFVPLGMSLSGSVRMLAVQVVASGCCQVEACLAVPAA
ncbi:Hint domain-containing protein [Tanticharoenia sakaeratensis]|uniref:Hedgehog/Intein (Hint) domain-containing protein n=1 Tax=Tanticharoenia sakaeratensis NBRC 103193 TaxID=1231623 RepID=A0A0D6MPN1_9PROT|nr:Hint domain-containing protein [Tanticharoenia sakaeratensis]GAN55662.1 hypothetical protein Tasa_052_025 [Tanticharoenia sakaeratensis NBRC 103193]